MNASSLWMARTVSRVAACSNIHTIESCCTVCFVLMHNTTSRVTKPTRFEERLHYVLTYTHRQFKNSTFHKVVQCILYIANDSEQWWKYSMWHLLDIGAPLLSPVMRVEVSDRDFARRFKDNIHSEQNQISNLTRQLLIAILTRVQTEKYCVSRASPPPACAILARLSTFHSGCHVPPLPPPRPLLRNPGSTPGHAYQRLHRGGLGC